MKTIKLSKGYKCLVDDEDYPWLNKTKWCVSSNLYAVRGGAYKKKQYTIKMHRLILEKYGIDIKDKDIDHINGNSLDNRKINLRACTHQENSRNRRISNRTSGYKGVNPNCKNWEATIYLNGKLKYLGTFTTPQEAALAYNEAASKYFGEFARLNKS